MSTSTFAARVAASLFLASGLARAHDGATAPGTTLAGTSWVCDMRRDESPLGATSGNVAISYAEDGTFNARTSRFIEGAEGMTTIETTTTGRWSLKGGEVAHEGTRTELALTVSPSLGPTTLKRLADEQRVENDTVIGRGGRVGTDAASLLLAPQDAGAELVCMTGW